ncbi:hypothetical protein JTY60_01795 [symbiont of Argiope bruennichi]|uniref:hypothetical protein n=1 Tax=symbiont of Argiope bruennichi TaxID=2810479 RepID=UPI003DA3E89B
MKIEKKLKTFLLSSLTIFASVISVVGCERTTINDGGDQGDQNYKDFVNKLLKKISPKNYFFPGNHTSVQDFYKNDTAWREHYSLTDAKIDLDNLKFYDISGYKDRNMPTIRTAKPVTSLKDGNITYDADGNVLFNGVSLDNILFAEILFKFI